MSEFLTLLPPDKALALFLSHIKSKPEPRITNTQFANGRVSYAPVLAPHPLPEFNRTTVDGYALRAVDTYGASESLPAYLKIMGEIQMGKRPDMVLAASECALIHTGGMVPEGADAVVMVENTQVSREGELEVLRAVAVGENIIQVGEDVRSGQEVLPGGTHLGPAEIGGLMALGITQLEVARRPRVGIVSSGDEVIPPEQRPAIGQVRDVNAYTLYSLVEIAGGKPMIFGIIPDSEDAMVEAAWRAKKECDMVVITAGSSASTRDLTSRVIDQLGKPGVLVHGVNVRPGKPTILAVCDGTPMIGLPGNPVSALVIAGLFVTPVIEKLLGEIPTHLRATIPARLTINLESQAGREDWVPVKVVGTQGQYQAVPIFGRSNLIFTLAGADGLIRIPPEATGLSAGDPVEVTLM